MDRLRGLAAGRDFVVAPQRVYVPNLDKLSGLERELREFPTRRRLLTVKQFLTYADALRRMRRAVAGLAQRVRKSQHSEGQEAYLARIGRLFLDAPADVLAGFVLNRRKESWFQRSCGLISPDSE
jgi:hypothetical protein